MENAKQPIHQLNVYSGLTKREHFSIELMKGILSNPSDWNVSTSFILEYLGLPPDTKYLYNVHYPQYLAKTSISFADALLNELSSQ